MKAKRTLLVLGLLAALQATASGQSTNSVLSASTTTTTSKTQASDQSKQPKLEPVYSTQEYQLLVPKLATNEERIVRIGQESSQAWTTIATHQPNLTVAHDVSAHEPEFCLFSLGHKPWR